MKSLYKRLPSACLAVILCISLCIPVFAAEEAEHFSEENISELFSLLGETDGFKTEDLSYELYQAFETNPKEFIETAVDLQDDKLSKMAELLVYFAGYFDLDDFKEQVISCKDETLTESETRVVEKILQEIDFQQNKTIVVGPTEELPEAPKYNPYFLDKLISAHVANNNFEDEEFYETLSNVLIEDPAVFSNAIEEISVVAQNEIISGVAQACVDNRKTYNLEDTGSLTREQANIISKVQEQIDAIDSETSLKVELGENGDLTPMSTQVPTIGTMTYSGDLICGEATTLTVNFSETTATSSTRTYWTEVYAIRNGKEHLKSSKSITFAKGSTSTTQRYSITFSDTGEVYTLVKVYSTRGGTLLTQRQGKYSDIITGPWSIIVTLPKDRNYKGSLSLYHANGAIQKTCECLGLAEGNGPMTQEEGNTPTGTYRGEIYPAHSNTHSYGPYKRINMVGVSGIAKTSGRTGIMIHGGDPTTDTSLHGYPLRCTHGCIRVTNSNQKGLVDLISTLISDFYADTYGEVVVSES